MSTTLLSDTAPPGGMSAEPRTLRAALVAAVLLFVRKYLRRKAASPPELLSRADFHNEMRDVSERIHAGHLALREKLDANHRELLAALERQGARINALEGGFARLDERTAR
jgi:hypothetical protein